MTTQPPQGFQQPSKRRRGIVFMVIGGVLGFFALLGLLIGLNAAAYLMGAGTEIKVKVTESSLDVDEGGHDGSGYYIDGGERISVRLSYVEAGETVTARLPLIPIPAIGNPVITNSLDAEEKLPMLISVVVVGLPAVLVFRNGRGYYTGRLQAQRSPLTRRN